MCQNIYKPCIQSVGRDKLYFSTVLFPPELILLAVGNVGLNAWLVQWKSPEYAKTKILVN